MLEAEDRSLWEIHYCDEYICQLSAIEMNFREDEKGFHDSKKFVTQRRENEANSLHLSLHLNRQPYSCFHDVVFILILKDFHLYKILKRNGVVQVTLSTPVRRSSCRARLISRYFSLKTFICTASSAALDLTVDMHRENALKHLEFYY